MQQLKELNSLYEDEQRTREEQHQAATKAEKRANDLALEVEEIKAQLEQVESVPHKCILFSNWVFFLSSNAPCVPVMLRRQRHRRGCLSSPLPMPRCRVPNARLRTN